jgi:hypothetical protein
MAQMGDMRKLFCLQRKIAVNEKVKSFGSDENGLKRIRIRRDLFGQMALILRNEHGLE